MPKQTWTKNWTASNNGESLGGADLGSIQSDIKSTIDALDFDNQKTKGFRDAGMDDNASASLYANDLHQYANGFVKTGLTYSSASGFTATFAAGRGYAVHSDDDPDRLRLIIKSASWTVGTADGMAATSDNYVDIYSDGAGGGTAKVSPVSIGASAPAVFANSVRLAKLVTNGSTVTSSTDLRPTSQSAGSDLFNWNFNGDFEIWGSGTTNAPTGWTLAGAAATVAKNTTAAQFKFGTASAALTRAGTDCQLYQDINLISGFGPVGVWASKQVTFGAWVRATAASTTRLQINDGVDTTSSSYHTGGSTLEFLTVTKTLSSSATRVRIQLSVETSNVTSQIDGAVLVRASTVSDFLPSGWRGRKGPIHIDSGATTVTASVYFGSSFGSGTEAEVLTDVPYKGVMRNLFFRGDSGSGFTVFIRKNSTNTSLTGSSGGGATGSDVANEVEFAKGDDLSAIATAGTGNVRYRAVVEYEEIP